MSDSAGEGNVTHGHAPGWERLATREGGTVAALATGGAGATDVFAATAIGLHRSTDAGRSWGFTGAGNSLPFVEALAVSPDFATGGPIFAGTRGGLYRSSDQGEHWDLFLAGDRITAVVAAAGDAGEEVVLAGAESDGIFRSTDGGHRWASASAGLLDLSVMALALSPDFARDRTGFAATGAGLYRTRNGGKSWRALDLPVEEAAVQALAVSPTFSDDGIVLAGTEAAGVLWSNDAGAHWETAFALASEGVTAVALSARGTFAAATGAGIAISRSGGHRWRTTGAELGPVLSLRFVSNGEAEILLAGLVGQGVARSTDGGATWRLANAGLHAGLLLDLALSPAFVTDRTIVAASPEDGILRSTDGGRTWAAHNAGLADTAVLKVAFSPRYSADQTLYAATGSGLYRSRDSVASWEFVNLGEPPAPLDALAVGLVAGGAEAMLAVMSAGRLLLSPDAGGSWRMATDVFTGARVVGLAVSPDYGRDRTLFVATVTVAGGSDTVTLWRSTDGGAHWESWLEEAGHSLLSLALTQGAGGEGRIFVGLGGRISTPRRNAWETRAGWRRPLWRGTELAGDGVTVIALAAVPNFRHEATLFAATNRGVYRSRNAGQTFDHWDEGRAPGPVVALAVSPNYGADRLVYAVGLDGAIWQRADR
jgi:hypothetical protein